eukprot:CAMPEP_0113682448 /NCGR_PEP_ID=MMETSP0038_2-20120614/12670_1 /TAXON_ID=2898 /ORGANISM="Cryptomonas paramecium" /LENGTH=85 /DNA_ID=CAMNT_0000601521 /DNA_START=68 /DNA_END=325 /DNA_ORIENTATION=+ /assembly_acc=CAM_ASM_000170
MSSAIPTLTAAFQLDLNEAARDKEHFYEDLFEENDCVDSDSSSDTFEAAGCVMDFVAKHRNAPEAVFGAKYRAFYNRIVGEEAYL